MNQTKRGDGRQTIAAPVITGEHRVTHKDGDKASRPLTGIEPVIPVVRILPAFSVKDQVS
jgi:hypothetical protein